MEWFRQNRIKFKNTVANWRRSLNVCQNQQVFGLDIGTSAVKLIQLRKNDDNYTVTAAGIAYVDDLLKDDVHKEISITKAIHKCIQSAGVKTKLAVCGVCGSETAVRHFIFPLLPPEEIKGAVELEAKQVCPFNTDDGVIDYQVLPDDKKDVRGVLVVATNKLLMEKSRFVKDSALKNVLMDVDGLALLNCLQNCQEYETGKTAAILNVGSSYTTLAIISDDNLPFVRDLNCAGKAIIEHISLKNKVSPEIAERILMGCENPDNIRLKVRENLETACQKLITNINETLYYDAVRRKSEMIEKIFLCGGFALVEGFADLLKSKLPAETVLWNPFDRISCDVSEHCADILREKGPAFAVAAGLAMRAI